MKRIRLELCIAILAVLSCRLVAGNEQYSFKSIDVQNGLSQNTVNAIIQDRNGFMWFGTKSGLNRYDGTDFRIYRHDPSVPGSLINNYVTTLLEGNDGAILVGTDFGLDIYFPETDSFTHVNTFDDAISTVGHTITAIERDANDNVWIAIESQGVVKYSIRDGSVEYFYADSNPCLKSVMSIYFDPNGTMWLGSYGYGVFFSFDGLKTILPLRDPVDGSEPLAGELVMSIIGGPYNHLFIGSMSSGISDLNLSNMKVSSVKMRDDNNDLIRCRSLMLKSTDELWAGTESGLFIIDLLTNKATQLRTSFYDRYSLSANSIYSMCKDIEGGIWVGTYFGGVNYNSPEYDTFKNYYPKDANDGLTGKRVREICEDNHGKLWIGTEDDGLFRFNPVNQSFEKNVPSMSFNNIHGLCLVGDELWVGTISKGLKIIDTGTGRLLRSFENTEDRHVLVDNNIYSIHQTSAGDILLGTQFGLMKYRPSDDSFVEVPELNGKHIYDIQEDTSGNLWLATFADGAFMFKVGDNTWKQYKHDDSDPNSLPYDMVLSIYEDSDRNVWLTTQGGGCCIFRPETDDFKSVSTKDGLPDNAVFQIIEGRKGLLWMTTNKGIVCYNRYNEIPIALYSTENGILCNQFNYKSSYKSKDGTIYFGCIEGLTAFNPDNLYPNKYKPKISVTDFMLLGRNVIPGEKDSPLEKSICCTEQILLDANQNTFSFRLVAPNFVSPQANIIEYKLDGYDKEWQTGGTAPVASYSRLRHGSYTFKARLMARGDNSDEALDTLAIKIRIKAPPFLTGWAFLFYLLILSGIISLYVITTRRRNEARYSMHVAQIEQEVAKSAYDSKIEFFTNVTHEIKTPLALISGPLESVLDKENLDDETREELTIMKQNTDRLVDLTNQLLDFKQTESEKYKLGFTDCNVTEVLRNIFVRFTTFARQKNLAFSLDVPDEDFHAHINKEAFTKIISNMLNNGLKYAGSFIRVSMLVPDGGDSFSIRTENDGEIVPDDMKEDIFKPFVRYNGNRGDSSVSGTGIGLGLCRSLASLHGGQFYMEKGEDLNVFVLTLPSRQESVMMLTKDPDLSIMNERSVDNDEVNDERQTILVVEDDSGMLAFLTRQLQKQFNVVSASNGKDALDIMDNCQVSLVLSDIMMPVMDGMELCRTIKSEMKYSHIPVILLTAKSNIQSKVEGMETGADYYIEKPFSVKYLTACISNLLESRAKLRKAFAQSPFIDSNTVALTGPDREFLDSVNAVIEANYPNADFSMDDMAQDLNMSRSSFYRKIKGVLDMSPNDYLRLVRLKKASELLQSRTARVNEVSYLVGFNSLSYFAKCFQKQFGISPKEFMSRTGR